MEKPRTSESRERWLPILADSLVSLVILALALGPLLLLTTPQVPIGKEAMISFMWSAGPAMLVLGGTFVYVRALLRERRRIESRLEEVVEERTQELQAINQELRDEIYVRQQAERSFRRSSRHF
ncbi:MAG: hypothetical protein ACOCVV_03840, partial [Marinobacter sp.]